MLYLVQLSGAGLCAPNTCVFHVIANEYSLIYFFLHPPFPAPSPEEQL